GGRPRATPRLIGDFVAVALLVNIVLQQWQQYIAVFPYPSDREAFSLLLLRRIFDFGGRKTMPPIHTRTFSDPPSGPRRFLGDQRHPSGARVCGPSRGVRAPSAK